MAGTLYEFRLRKNYKTILRDLDPRKVLPHLYQEAVFDFDDMDEVKAEKTRKRQAEALLDILSRCGERGFEVFVNALQETQRHLAVVLTTPVPGELELGMYDNCKEKHVKKTTPLYISL